MRSMIQLRHVLRIAFYGALLVAGLAQAHGDGPHVMGTLEAVHPDSVEVRTTAGENVSITLQPDTEVRRGTARATLSELQTGERVVVHTHKHGSHLMAVLIKVSSHSK